jgi:hypothetical protein
MRICYLRTDVNDDVLALCLSRTLTTEIINDVVVEMTLSMTSLCHRLSIWWPSTSCQANRPGIKREAIFLCGQY